MNINPINNVHFGKLQKIEYENGFDPYKNKRDCDIAIAVKESKGIQDFFEKYDGKIKIFYYDDNTYRPYLDKYGRPTGQNFLYSSYKKVKVALFPADEPSIFDKIFKKDNFKIKNNLPKPFVLECLPVRNREGEPYYDPNYSTTRDCWADEKSLISEMRSIPMEAIEKKLSKYYNGPTREDIERLEA